MVINEEEKLAVAPRHAKQSEGEGVASLYEWVEAAVFSLIVVVLVFAFIFRIVGVDGRSMEPTLKNHDRLILTHFLYQPKRGDIVVINRYDNEPLVKRIIAVGGDTIEITDTTGDGRGDVLLNGQLLNESYIQEGLKTEQHYLNNGVLTIPKGYVFVMGDNRGRGCSRDSRSGEAGLLFVDERDLMGKAVYRIWPFESFGGLYDYES